MSKKLNDPRSLTRPKSPFHAISCNSLSHNANISEEKTFSERAESESFAMVAGSGNRELAEAIAERLDVRLMTCEVGRFTNGETRVRLDESVRGRPIVIFCSPRPHHINDDLMEILVLADTLRRSSATEITAVIPLFPYARQDRKAEGRVPITAALVMNLLEAAGVTRIITVDLHCGQIQGMTPRPVDNIFGNIEFVKCVRRTVLEDLGEQMENVAIISPDGGGVPRAKQLKEGTNAGGLAFIIKQRAGAGVVERMDLIGDVTGKVCFIVDDLCDTGGTLCLAASVLKDKGATRVFGCITHGLFCGRALQLINESPFERLFVTNTLYQGNNVRECPKITVIDVSELMANVIERAHSSSSISALFSY